MNDPFDDLVDEALSRGTSPISGAEVEGPAHGPIGFTASVMATVRTEALAPLPFPWRRIGLAVGLAAAAAILSSTLATEPWNAPLPSAPAAWLAPFAVVALLIPRILAAVAGEGS